MKLSIIIPIMNEEENIPYLYKAIIEALGTVSYEIIFINDGSTDKSIEQIRAIPDKKVKLLILNKNYGQTTAMNAGIDHAMGELIITMDGDLQNDPSDIPRMIKVLEEEQYDVVFGWRKERQDSTFLRKVPSKIANYLIRKLTGVNINDYGCTLKVFKMDVAKNLDMYGELHRFIPVLSKIYGAKITEIPVKHHPRIYGISKYGLGRTFRVLSDLLLVLFIQKYKQKPMHLFGVLGIGFFLLGFFINFYLLIEKLLGHDIGNRPLLTVGVISILVGIQLITTGFIADLIMRTYYGTSNKKPYTIKKNNEN